MAVGLAALGANTTASNNTAIGENAGQTTAGDSNVFERGSWQELKQQ